jgi:hypothetical protein
VAEDVTYRRSLSYDMVSGNLSRLREDYYFQWLFDFEILKPEPRFIKLNISEIKSKETLQFRQFLSTLDERLQELKFPM